MNKLAIALVLAAAVAVPVLAQSPATKPAPAPAPAASPAAAKEAPPAPTMSPEGKKLLEGLIGRWTIKDAVFKVGAEEMKGKFTIACEKAADGWATLCKGDMNLGAMKSKGAYLFGWDIVTGQGHMFEIESTANVHDHVGKWSDDKTISLVHTGKNIEGKEETDTLTFSWVSPREVTFVANGKSKTTTNWTFTGTMKK